MTELHDLTVAATTRAISRREVSAEELMSVLGSSLRRNDGGPLSSETYPIH